MEATRQAFWGFAMAGGADPFGGIILLIARPIKGPNHPNPEHLAAIENFGKTVFGQILVNGKKMGSCL